MQQISIGKEFIPQYPLPLVEQITEFLTNAIIEGRLENGQRLVENELQRKFEISRAPIREAFRVLEKNGLVVLLPRKGTFVRKITKKDVEENFPIRANLEGLAARLAIPHISPEDIEQMKSSLSMMAEAAKNNDFTTYFKNHSEYHETFIKPCKNDTLIGILKNLRQQALWFRFSYLWHQESYEYAIRIHREILDSFIKQEADRVETLVKGHIIIALKRFHEFLEQKG